MDVVYANGDRSVPVRNRRNSSVGGVGVRRYFRKVIRVAARFAGSSSRADQADEKVTVIVFVCQGASQESPVSLSDLLFSVLSEILLHSQ